MTKRINLVIASIGLIVSLSGCDKLGVGAKKQGGLQVTSNETYAVYLDEINIGQTPFFGDKIQAKEYNLKLVPQANQTDVWQTRVVVNQSVLTVVKYDLEADTNSPSSLIMQLEPLGDKDQTQMSIVSIPDGVAIRIDGELKGAAPLVLEQISAGDHVLVVEAPGYVKKTVNLKTSPGYSLKVNLQLAKEKVNTVFRPETEASPSAELATNTPTPAPSPQATESAKAQDGFGTKPVFEKQKDGIIKGATKPDQLKKPYVKILSAQPGINWLRVRSGPAGGTNEVAKVLVGTYFPFKGRDDNGYVKLEYDTGKYGWIVSRYGQVTE